MAEMVEHVPIEAAVVDSKIPLAEGLRAMAGELGRCRTGRCLRRAARRMERGDAVKDALAKARLPRAVRELLRAAVDSGRLAEVMRELVELAHARRDLRRQILTVFAYPAFTFLAVGCVFLLLGFVVAPMFTATFDDSRGLPIFTRVVLLISTKGILPFFAVMSAILALTAAAWLTPGSALLERLTYWIPLVGGPRRYGRLMRFARLSALLIEQKEPLPDALRWAGAGSGSTVLRRTARRLAREVERGEPLDAAMARRRAIPPTMIPCIAWGLENDRLAESFRAAENAFHGRVATHAERLAVLVLPLTLLFLASVLPVFVVAMILPMLPIISPLI